MTKPAVRIEHLSKQYRTGDALVMHSTLYETLARLFSREGASPSSKAAFWALDDINFDIAPGEVVGIIGRNGAGKSTLLKLLSRITAPTRGRIEVRGRLASLLEVGTGFHPELTGRENIFLNGAILGMRRSQIQRQFDAIVSFAEIERFVDTPVKRYSSGMYVRLAFAVAAHLDADVLLVDEVLAVGDYEFQKRCLGKMQDVAHDGRTVLLVSHNLDAIQVMCQRAVWIERGRVQSIGASTQVVQGYLRAMETDHGRVLHDSGALEVSDVQAHCTPAGGELMHVHVAIELRCNQGIDDLWVDFGLETARGQRLVHVMCAPTGKPTVRIAAGETATFTFDVELTRLSAAEYVGALYAHTRSGALVLDMTKIPLFTAPPAPGALEATLPTFSGLLSPAYASSLRVHGTQPQQEPRTAGGLR